MGYSAGWSSIITVPTIPLGRGGHLYSTAGRKLPDGDAHAFAIGKDTALCGAAIVAMEIATSWPPPAGHRCSTCAQLAATMPNPTISLD